MKLIIKTYIIILSLLFCLASCISEEIDTPIIEESNLVSIELFTRLNEPFRTPVSRAADESGIDKDPWILVFKDSGSGERDDAMFVEVAKTQFNSNINRSYVWLTPQPQTEKYWVLILANPQAFFYANSTPNDFKVENFNSVLTGKTLEEATSLLSAMPITTDLVVNTPPFNGEKLPMSYVSPSPLNGIDASTTFGTESVPLELTRSVAKIVVKSDATASGFTLQGIHSVYYMNNHTLLHNLSGNPPVPTASDQVNYVNADPDDDFVSATYNISDAMYVSEAIYVYEQTNNSTNSPYMIIKGTYNKNQYYYKMDLTDTDKTLIDFNRNYEYVFTIKEVLAPGYASYDEAMRSTSSNKQIDFEVKITHTEGYESTANAEYYLSVSNRLCLIYDEANEREYLAFTVVTNCTKDFSDKSNYIESSENHLIVQSPSSAKIKTATDANTPVSTDVIVSVDGLGEGLIRLKLGNIEQAVTVKKIEDIIPAAGRILSYYEWDSVNGWPIFNYYLSTGLVSSGSGITLSTTRGEIFPDDPSKVTAEDGIINIHVDNNTGSSRNGVVWLTTIKNPGYPAGDDQNMARRIKVFLYQSGQP